jgi:SOS response associated peptidase (SRAP)
MCNLYSITTNQAAISALFRKINRYVGNLPPMPGVFPDYPAPVIRGAGDAEEMVLMRWGMPPPPRTGGPPVTNIRKTSSPHWRGWLKPENRCFVPANSFAEYAPEPLASAVGRSLIGLFRRPALKQSRTFFVHTDELGQVFNSEVGERLDAIFSDAVDPDDAVLDFHFVGDVAQPVFVFAQVLCDLSNSGDVVHLVDVRGHAA